MDELLFLWEVISKVGTLSRTFFAAYIFARFLEPFFDKKQNARIAGLCYLLMGIFTYFSVWEIFGSVSNLLCTLALFTGAVVTERKNIRQKIFLAAVIYLLPWLVHEAVVIPWFTVYDPIMLSDFVMEHPRFQIFCFLLLEAFYCALRAVLLYLLTRVISRIYLYKREDLTTEELFVMLLPLLPDIAGFFLIVYFEQEYIDANSDYPWNGSASYQWLLFAFQAVSFAAVAASVYMSQKIKKAQREEKRSAVLRGQTEDMRRHIEKLESVYAEVGNLRHDVKNHLITLESLYKRSETEEAERYSRRITEALDGLTFSIKSGDPVTDIIIDDKYRAARDKGIALESEFFFPNDAGFDVFDVSVILNNALDNAIENADGEKPSIRVSARSEKSAYLIEVANSFSGILTAGELPETTKPDKSAHGFGLQNIRGIAQKYHGDISLEAQDGTAVLTVMMIAPETAAAD